MTVTDEQINEANNVRLEIHKDDRKTTRNEKALKVLMPPLKWEKINGPFKKMWVSHTGYSTFYIHKYNNLFYVSGGKINSSIPCDSFGKAKRLARINYIILIK